MAQEPENDPLDLENVDREIRIQKRRNELQDMNGLSFGKSDDSDVDPALEEAFLEQVMAVEKHGFTSPINELISDGFPFPNPDELSDEALHEQLWRLIRELARRRLVLHSTDHLSDRELYDWLVNDALKEELMGFGLPFGNCHLDVLGSGSEEDIELQMRYYATDEDRANWLRDFPDDKMPDKEPRPFDRDRHLPQPTME